MQTGSETNALLNVQLRLAATPDIAIVKPSGNVQPVPVLQSNTNAGFSFELETALPYDKLTKVLDVFLRGKRLEVSEGFFRQHVILNGCKLYPGMPHQLVAEVPFSGSYSGTFYVTGTPFYNPQSRHIEVQNVAYDLKTGSLLLKGAKWLFGNLILDEIKKYTAVDLTLFYGVMASRIAALLNQQWTKGIQASGDVTDLVITGLTAQKQQLLVRGRCTGNLKIILSEIELTF